MAALGRGQRGQHVRGDDRGDDPDFANWVLTPTREKMIA